jgi:hypothetical protein
VGGEWVAGALEEALVLGGVVDAHSAVLDGCGGRTHTHNGWQWMPYARAEATADV